MTETTAAGVLRSLLATTATAGLATALAAAGRRLALGLPGSPLRVEEAVAVAVVVGGAAAAALLAAGSGLLLVGAIARLTGRTWRWCDRAAARVTPAVLRRAIAITVTTSLGVTAAAGAASASEIDLGWVPTEEGTQASEQTDHPDDPVPDEGAQRSELAVTDHASPDPTDDGTQGTWSPVVEPTDPEPEPDGRSAPAGRSASGTPQPAPAGPVPASDTRSGAPGVATPAAHHPADRDQVVVTAGDSLWSIARSRLSDPSDAEIAASWPRWYAANRAVIGADPDLIHPGQVLLAPAEDTTIEETTR